MAAEAVIIELIGKVPGCPVRYTCAEATTVAKGTLLQITDPRTASAHSAAGQAFGGICAMEKVGGDGSTSLTAYTNGIFDITAAAAGAQNVGKAVMLSATANMTTAADAAGLLISKVGNVLEEQANDETCAIRVLVGNRTS